MIHFGNDYTEGAHPKILERLVETNMEQAPGYGMDKYTKHAEQLIKKAVGREDVDVHLLSSGTQTNLTIISASLRPYQGVITADSGHILTLEAGAVEAVGHQIIPLSNRNGKITAKQVGEFSQAYKDNPTSFHKPEPGMVYLSNPTEVGTLYSKQELEDLRQVCDTFDLKLFIDGARLGYGLVSESNDLTLNAITNLTDVFYFGGTKIGALFGEAVIIKNDEIKCGFKTLMKQKGSLLAKGRALGIQFEVLFENDLYLDSSRHAVDQAMRIKQTFSSREIPLKYEAHTNQLFPILTKSQINSLNKKYSMLEYQTVDENHSVIRICTSWGTRKENVDAFIQDIKKL